MNCPLNEGMVSSEHRLSIIQFLTFDNTISYGYLIMLVAADFSIIWVPMHGISKVQLY